MSHNIEMEKQPNLVIFLKCYINGTKALYCGDKTTKTISKAVIFFCTLFLCLLSFPSSALCSVRRYCCGMLLKDRFPCAIRLWPRSNMLSLSNQSPYLALWVFEEVGSYFTPYLHRKIQERAIICFFMRQSAPNGV